MRAKLSLVCCAAAISVLTGCATTRGEGGDRAGAAGVGLPSVRVGEARVLDATVNPLVPVRLGLHDGEIAVSFAHLRGGAHEQIDPESLEIRGRSEGPMGPEAPATSVQRIVLDHGRFLVCWTSGSLEWGHRAMAQMFNSSDGSPRGVPVAISPPNADVVGVPRAITSDGNHVVALFSATTGSSFQLVAVPIDDATSGGDAGRSARAMVP
jgi:hypothetical protein